MCMRSAFIGVEMLGGKIGWIQGLRRRRRMNQHYRCIPGAHANLTKELDDKQIVRLEAMARPGVFCVAIRRMIRRKHPNRSPPSLSTETTVNCRASLKVITRRFWYARNLPTSLAILGMLFDMKPCRPGVLPHSRRDGKEGSRLDV